MEIVDLVIVEIVDQVIVEIVDQVIVEIVKDQVTKEIVKDQVTEKIADLVTVEIEEIMDQGLSGVAKVETIGTNRTKDSHT